MKSGDMVIVGSHALCNPVWGSTFGASWSQSPELGLIIAEKRDFCKVKTDSRIGWMSKDNLRVLNTF